MSPREHRILIHDGLNSRFVKTFVASGFTVGAWNSKQVPAFDAFKKLNPDIIFTEPQFIDEALIKICRDNDVLVILHLPEKPYISKTEQKNIDRLKNYVCITKSEAYRKYWESKQLTNTLLEPAFNVTDLQRQTPTFIPALVAPKIYIGNYNPLEEEYYQKFVYDGKTKIFGSDWNSEFCLGPLSERELFSCLYYNKNLVANAEGVDDICYLGKALGLNIVGKEFESKDIWTENYNERLLGLFLLINIFGQTSKELSSKISKMMDYLQQ